MKILGFEITRAEKTLNTVSGYSGSGGWWNLFGGTIQESYTGAWQQNVTVQTTDNILRFSAVYACVTGIAGDIAKCRIKLDQNNDGIWDEITQGSPFLPVLRKPNHYQNRIQLFEQWLISKLLNGNTYVLKQRDGRGVVNALYVLDPCRVTPLVSDTGNVYYELKVDVLSEIPVVVTVPASEIIHDRYCPLWHPLIGVTPIYACGVSATMGARIQSNSTNLFGNRSMPGGLLLAPGKVSQANADALKAYWDTNFSGLNAGKVAILGDNMKFEQLMMNAVDSQLIEQLKWSVEDVARAFKYPIYKLIPPPAAFAASPEVLTTMYYSDCLQIHIESMELCLDEGLELPPNYGTEVDTDNLMRMDTVALHDAINKGERWLEVNEQRRRAGLGPTAGGAAVYRQQQDHSLESLAKRDAGPDPFGAAKPPAATPTPIAPPPAKEFDMSEFEAEFAEGLTA